MPEYFATCARGLEPTLATELTQLGASDVRPGRGGVTFHGGNELLYKANLWLRTAVRVLRPLKRGEVHSPDQLYDFVRSIDWREYLTTEHTLAVDSNVRDSAMTHSQYAARRVKDGICDQFRDRNGLRPSVDTERPMLGLNLHVNRNEAILSIDSSWDSLHKRGYRPIQARAPLNEALAAGLLLQTGWTPDVPLVDPMCGSGTFPIEAAWMAMKRPPGLTRKWFAFMGLLDFDRPLWNDLREQARRGMTAMNATIRGSDIRHDAVQMAEANAGGAGVGHAIPFLKSDLKDIKPPEGPPGVIICNPPYGERIGEGKELAPLYRAIGDMVGGKWAGWRLFVFTSNTWLARDVGRKVVKSTPFYNGSIPCHLWEFSNDVRFRKPGDAQPNPPT